MSGVFNWGMAALHGREYRGGTGTRDLNSQPRDGTNIVYILKKRNHCTVPKAPTESFSILNHMGLRSRMTYLTTRRVAPLTLRRGT